MQRNGLFTAFVLFCGVVISYFAKQNALKFKFEIPLKESVHKTHLFVNQAGQTVCLLLQHKETVYLLSLYYLVV